MLPDVAIGKDVRERERKEEGERERERERRENGAGDSRQGPAGLSLDTSAGRKKECERKKEREKEGRRERKGSMDLSSIREIELCDKHGLG